jgi:hypothetical protein
MQAGSGGQFGSRFGLGGCGKIRAAGHWATRGRTTKGPGRSNCLDKAGPGVLNFPSIRPQNGLQMGLKKNFKKQLTVPV